MQPPLAATFGLMLENNRAVSLADIRRVLIARYARYGVIRVLAAIIPRGVINPRHRGEFIILCGRPEAWAERYFRKRYGLRYPTTRHCAIGQAPQLSHIGVWPECSICGRQYGVKEPI